MALEAAIFVVWRTAGDEEAGGFALLLGHPLVLERLASVRLATVLLLCGRRARGTPVSSRTRSPGLPPDTPQLRALHDLSLSAESKLASRQPESSPREVSSIQL